jgi:hypothetical protein
LKFHSIIPDTFLVIGIMSCGGRRERDEMTPMEPWWPGQLTLTDVGKE